MTTAAPRLSLSSATEVADVPASESAKNRARPRTEATEPNGREPRSRRKLVLGAAAAVALIASGGYYLSVRGYESTDDAQVDGEIVAVPAKLSGTAAKLHFIENQEVKTGALLAELDDAPAKAKLAEADAALSAAEAAAEAADADARVARANATGGKAMASASLQSARAGAASARDQIAEARAARDAAKAAFAQAELDYARTDKLVQAGSLAQAARDQSETARSVARANFEAAEARLASVQTGVAQAAGHVSEAAARAEQTSDVQSMIALADARAKSAHAQVATARAARDLAALELSYTKILAPHDGVISKKSIAEGQALTAGQTIAQLVTPALWITANFKETQLGKLHTGQKVDFSVDAYPSAHFMGTVESFSGATGSRFTLLPPDNASGNFTKVVQRVPVRVHITSVPQGVVLRPGMSADVRVDTRD